MNDAFIEFTMDVGGRSVPIDPGKLSLIGDIYMQEIEKALDRAGKVYLKALRRKMYTEIRQRPRIEGQPLMRRLASAMKISLTNTSSPGAPGELHLGVFDWNAIQKATSRPGDDIGMPGWFSLFEDGHEGFDHGSDKFGFIEVDRAVELAERVAELYRMPDGQKDEFVDYVRDAFAGRHGEGIMVELNQPLFFAYPDYGTARDLGVSPHGGFKAWNTIKKATGPDSAEPGGTDVLSRALTSALKNTHQRLRRELK